MKKKPLYVNYNSEDVSGGHILFTSSYQFEQNPVNCNMLLFTSTLHCLPSAIQLNGYWLPCGNMFYDLSVTVYSFLARCFEIRFRHYSTYGAQDSSVKDI